MDRSHTDDDDMTPTQENSNVFDDEFAVDGFDMVADGFRPSSDGGAEEEEEERYGQEPPIRTVSAHYADNPALTMARSLPSRNSTRKSRGYDNPFASPEDEPHTSLERTPSMRSQSTASYAPGIARRSTSSASSNNFAGTSSPRFGNGAPSHPYGMYPQTVPRSPSAATSSTIRHSTRNSTLQQGPQHPYAMYPQGIDVDEGDDDDDAHTHSVLPVGFPGLGQPYRRYRGPDGEEQDIIGADGHAEQLPPYSRYPEEGPPKIPAPMLALPGQLHSRGPVAGTDPGMPLMHQHLVAQSMTDESQLGVRESLLPPPERTNSRDSMIDPEDWQEKTWKQKTWKEKRKTRFCGVPLSWILIGLCAFSFVAAVLGGAVGGYLSGAQHAREQAHVTVVSTSLYDASLIPTPTNSPPTGTFALSLSTPEATQGDCLTDPSQGPAWDCNLGGTPALAISVGVPPGPTQTLGAFLFYASNDDDISYGAQYQFMETTFSPFIAVQDNDDPAIGPAFYFEQTYDKVVVVPENAFSQAASDKTKRQWQFTPNWWQEKQVISPGEKPWFCVWNNTFMEGFIYVQQPVAASYFPVPTSTASLPAINTSMPKSTITGSPQNSPQTSPTLTPTGIPLTGPVTTTIAMSSTTFVLTASAQPTNWDAYASAHGYHHQNRRQSPADTYASLNMYPYVVKLEERRLPNNNIQPYCQQYQILDSMGWNWVSDDNGNPIIIQLDEADPNYGAYQSAGLAGSNNNNNNKRDGDTVPGGCHCQWMSGQ